MNFKNNVLKKNLNMKIIDYIQMASFSLGVFLTTYTFKSLSL